MPSMNVAGPAGVGMVWALKNGAAAQAHINASTTGVAAGRASSFPVPRFAAMGITMTPSPPGAISA